MRWNLDVRAFINNGIIFANVYLRKLRLMNEQEGLRCYRNHYNITSHSFFDFTAHCQSVTFLELCSNCNEEMAKGLLLLSPLPFQPIDVHCWTQASLNSHHRDQLHASHIQRVPATLIRQSVHLVGTVRLPVRISLPFSYIIFFVNRKGMSFQEVSWK